VINAIDQDRRGADEPALLGGPLGLDDADPDRCADQPDIAKAKRSS
jgi:hypothetical protein